MGAISDAVFMGDYNRFRAWMLAIAVAILGTQALHMTETVDVNQSIYLTTSFGWAGAIIGDDRRLRQQDPGPARRRQPEIEIFA